MSAIGIAQKDPAEERITCDYHDVTILQAIKDVFGRVGISYSVQEGIGGRVTAHLPKMTFDRALQALLRSCYLTYRCEGGVYQIVKREAQDPPEPPLDPPGLPKDKGLAVKAVNENAIDLLDRVLRKSGKPYVIGLALPASVSLDVSAQPLAKTLVEIGRQSHGTVSFEDGVWIFSGPPPPDEPSFGIPPQPE
ncbi:MAG TPA: hypothetical protein VMI31_06425 [Fimbriimonadaceae bacterium]|nr:hypothetical protein [Fimbriimonadaceae bacterium]